jgi:hypothetical protein
MFRHERRRGLRARTSGLLQRDGPFGRGIRAPRPLDNAARAQGAGGVRMTSRMATVYLDDLETLETCGELLIREGHSAPGVRLLAICLRLREQTQLYAAEQVFMCDDIDESAGLAEIHELHGYSRKTPCA